MSSPTPPIGGRPVRVILGNDVELIVEGLRTLLAPYRDRVEVVGLASGDPDIMLESLVHDEADVLLIDTFSRTGAGIDAARAVLATKPPFEVAIFTEADDLGHLLSALRVGVRGYLLKTIGAAELVDGLERIAAGETVVDHKLATDAAVLAARSTANLDWEGSHLGLSRREADVLKLLASGCGTVEIGQKLDIGKETVRSHIRQIYRRLGVNDRAAAVAVAWREGLGT